MVSAEDIDWLVAHLQAVVTVSPAAWAGRGMTSLQLTALHFISAQAPVPLIELAHALGTGSPTTSAMVDRLTGLVCSAPNPQDRRRVQLTISVRAEPIVGDIDLDTARHLQTVLHGMSPQARRTLSTSSGTPYDAPGSLGSALLARKLPRSLRHSQRGLSEMANGVDAVQYEVMIEGEAHPWAKDIISVPDIRELGNLPADAPVIEQDLRDGTERTLTEDDVLRPGKLKEGTRLTKKRVNFRKG
jgi:DNA-binding MarR family transcriptional regulator